MQCSAVSFLLKQREKTNENPLLKAENQTPARRSRRGLIICEFIQLSQLAVDDLHHALHPLLALAGLWHRLTRPAFRLHRGSGTQPPQAPPQARADVRASREPALGGERRVAAGAALACTVVVVLVVRCRWAVAAEMNRVR